MAESSHKVLFRTHPHFVRRRFSHRKQRSGPTSRMLSFREQKVRPFASKEFQMKISREELAMGQLFRSERCRKEIIRRLSLTGERSSLQLSTSRRDERDRNYGSQNGFECRVQSSQTQGSLVQICRGGEIERVLFWQLFGEISI